MEKEVIKERMFDGIKYICTNGRKEKSKCLSIFVIIYDIILLEKYLSYLFPFYLFIYLLSFVLGMKLILKIEDATIIFYRKNISYK